MIVLITWLGALLLLLCNLYVVTSFQNSSCISPLSNLNFDLLNWTPWNAFVLKDGKLRQFNISLCSNVTLEGEESSVSEFVDGQYKTLASLNIMRFHKMQNGILIWFRGPVCNKQTNGYHSVTFQFDCGPTLGSPEYILEYMCETHFQWKTSAACSAPPMRREVPCYVYDKNGLKRDLSPLIKQNGGYLVQSANLAVEFFINVCSDIFLDEDTSFCPEGSAACRKIGSEHISFGKPNTPLQMVDDNLVLKYSISNVTFPANCDATPQTTITFKCPPRGRARAPRLVSDANCHYEVEWETEHACPEDILLGDKKECKFTRKEHGVEIDLSPLRKEEGNYQALGYINKKRFDFLLNVCGGLGRNVECNETDWKINSVCAIDSLTRTSHIIGMKKDWILRYADGKIILWYPGHVACNGTDTVMSTVINFYCDEDAEDNGTGIPTFVALKNCVYRFDWESKHACMKRPILSQCFIDKEEGHIDLGDLAIQKGTPWIALDQRPKNSNDTHNVQYLLNVCNEIPHEGTQSICDPEASACKIENGHAESLGKFTSPPTYLPYKYVRLEYTEGSQCGSGQQRRSIITFICKPGHLNTAPMLVRVSEDDCLYEFQWHTAEACPEGEIKGSSCSLGQDDFYVDLYPLHDEKYYKITTQDYTFYLNVCGEVTGTPCDQNGKTQNAAVCQVENKSQNSRYWKLGEPDSEITYFDGMINLTYTGGTPYNDAHQTPRVTTIAFICDPKKGRGTPHFVEEVNYAYVFHWYTNFACSDSTLLECVVTDPKTHKQYDLSRLTKVKQNWEIYRVNGGKFYLNICQRLNPVPAPCSSQAAICSVDVKDGKEIVSVSNLGQPDMAPVIYSEGHIQLWYRSGDPCVKYGKEENYTTVINFVCVHGLQDDITFLGVVGNCEYNFMWLTRAACPIETVQSKESCNITHPESGYIFDLSPLKKSSGYIVKSHSQTFQLNICGGITEGGCQSLKGSSPSHDVAVCTLDANGTAQTILGLEESSVLTISEDGYITLMYEGPPTSEGKASKVIITFECMNTSESSPQFAGQDGNEFLFYFNTPLVCQHEPYSCTLISLEGRQYDLSPLSLKTWKITDSRPAYKDLMYHISFCRPLTDTDGYKCPVGGAIGACQTNIKDSAKEGYSLGYLSESPVISDSGTITIHYRGGALCHGEFQRSTRINLYCSDVQKSPVFIGETPECEYIFSFQTPAACPLKNVEGENCTVFHPTLEYEFDLSILRKYYDNYNVSVGEYSYLLNVCGNLNNPPLQCKDSASCQTKPSDPGHAVNAGLKSSKLEYKNGVIQLTYESGEGNCHKNYNRSTVISFVCNNLEFDTRGPSFIGESDDCTYMFEWQTTYACPPSEWQECTAVDKEGRLYDLSGLSMVKDNYAVSSPFVPNKTFIINVCRTVIQKPDAHCPANSSVCLLDVTEKDPLKRRKNLGRLGSGPYFENDKLKLMYTFGDDCSESSTSSPTHMESIITFECDQDVVDSGPEFVGKDGCTYYFTWTTSAACPILENDHGSAHRTGDCIAVNPVTGHQFDFNVLKREEPYIVYSTGNHRYLLNICGDVKNSSCGIGVGACQEEISGMRHWIGGKTNSYLHYMDGVMFINYTNGDYCHQKKYQRNTIIQFVCDPNRFGMGHPKLLFESEDCTYFFEWSTDIACEDKVHCAVRNGSDVIDLSSLMSKSDNYIALSPSDSGFLYYLSVCHQLNPIKGVSCPPRSSACRIGPGNSDVISLGTPLMPPFIDFEDHVTIIYSNGSQCTSNSSIYNKARIIFICDPAISQGEPVFVKYDAKYCVYVFEWSTRIVCPKEVFSLPSSTNCTFSDKISGLEFDLSLLRKTDSEYKITGDDSTEYLLNICGSVSSSKSGSCDSAAVCSNASNGEVSFGAADSGTFLYDGKRLWLKYGSGSKCSLSGDKRSAVVIFACSPNIGTGTPSFHLKTECSVIFIWHTTLACPVYQKECAVVANDNKLVDLHLLSSVTHSWSTNDSVGNKYWINICHGIIKSPDSFACPHSSAVCKVDTNGKTTSLGLAETLKLDATDSGIMLTYSHGDDKSCSNLETVQSAVTQIHFTCGKTFGKPKFISDPGKNCVFSFEWETNVACSYESDLMTLDESGKLHDLRLNRTVDISPLLNKTFRVHSNRHKDEYIFVFNLKHGMKNVTVGNSCANAAVCQMKPDSTSFYRDIGTLNTLRANLKGSELQLVLTSHGRPCGKKSGRNVTSVINLQCSSAARLGEPVFLYESKDCTYMFTWDTSILCLPLRPSGDGHMYSNIVSDEGTKPSTSHVNTSHVVTALVLTALFICVIFFIVYKRDRRESIARKVKGAFVKIHLPRFRYRRVNGESLLLSDGGTGTCYHDDGSDVDIIT